MDFYSVSLISFYFFKIKKIQAFLADYGMIWVGEEEEPFKPQCESLTEDGGKETEERSALTSTFQGTNSAATDGLWRPGNCLKLIFLFLVVIY